jgi:cardiolipin synthase
MTFGSIALLLFDLALLQLALGLVLERRNPAATWFWLLVLFFAPIFGLPLYLLVGRAPVRRTVRRHGQRLRAQRAALRTLAQRVDPNCEREALFSFEPLANLVVGVGGSAPRLGHRVHWIQDGPELVSRMRAALRGATRYAYFETYIFEDGDSGRALREELEAAARRGVEVRLLCDAVGSSSLASDYFAAIEELGGRVEWFAPLRFWKKRRRPDLRNHRKVLVVDGREAFVGGFNVSDEYVRSDRPRRPWRDTHAHIQGPAALDLEALFLESWAIATGEVDDAHAAEAALQILGAGDGGERGCAVQVLAGGPEEDWPRLELAYLASIHAARARLDIATPYFVPSESVCSALAGAALRGVHVRLLLPAPEANDVRLVSWASRSYYADMLDAGVRIFEYGPRMHHAKTLVADGLLSFIGTANLDMRSLRLNYEIATLVYDPAAAAELEESFEVDLRSAQEISAAELAGWSRFQRLRNAFARLLSPLL